MRDLIGKIVLTQIVLFVVYNLLVLRAKYSIWKAHIAYKIANYMDISSDEEAWLKTCKYSYMRRCLSYKKMKVGIVFLLDVMSSIIFQGKTYSEACIWVFRKYNENAMKR